MTDREVLPVGSESVDTVSTRQTQFEYKTLYDALFDKEAKWVTLDVTAIPPEYIGPLICLKMTISSANFSFSNFGYISTKLVYQGGLSVLVYNPIDYHYPYATHMHFSEGFDFEIRFPSEPEIARINAATCPLYHRNGVCTLPVKLRVDLMEDRVDARYPY